MTGILRRVATGYPVLSYLYVVAYYAANAVSTFTFTAGPGEILGFSMFKFSGSIDDYSILGVTITIDGTVVFAGYFADLISTNLRYNGQGMFWSHTILDVNACATSFKLNMPYELTASIVFQNLSANQLGLGFGVPVRRGA